MTGEIEQGEETDSYRERIESDIRRNRGGWRDGPDEKGQRKWWRN